MNGPTIIIRNEWGEVDIDPNLYGLRETEPMQHYAKLNFSDNATMKDIFTSFVNEDLKMRKWKNGGPDMWCYKSGGKNSAINGGHNDSKAIDRLFAHQIRLIGFQNGPVEGGGVKGT